MKLKELFENEFQNKEHKSINSEISHLRSKIQAINKECTRLQRLRLGIRANLHNRYLDRNKQLTQNIDWITNKEWLSSPECVELNRETNKINDKLSIISSNIDKNKKQIIQASSRTLFDAQRKENKSTTLLPNTPTIVSGGSKTTNPYFGNVGGKYYGLPQDYPNWTMTALKEYNALSKHLKANNLPGFTTMYVGKSEHNTKAIVLGNNGLFMWRFTISNYGPQDGFVHSSIKVGEIVISTKQFMKDNNLKKSLLV